MTTAGRQKNRNRIFTCTVSLRYAVDDAKQTTGQTMDTVYYFGYGSNLNLADFDRYCLQKGFAGGGLRTIGAAKLPGYRLTFSHYSAARGGGALNLEADADHSVSGVLFSVETSETWAALDLKEGHPERYQKTPIRVRSSCGNTLAAATYIVQRPKAAYFRPTDEYVRVVAAGLEAFGLCTRPLYAAARTRHAQLT
jgi:cation transport regulator ChaC